MLFCTWIFCAGALEDGVRCGDRALPSLASYESNVLYALRFMVDSNMGGGQWLEIPAGMLSCGYCC
jgi:DNA polymerase delta subunit 1